jgi:rhamnogalacturonyl hydrolase YesR
MAARADVSSRVITGAFVHELDRTIQLLIRNLVEIKDTSGEFLLRLDDGRVIDTKGWNDWEWTHGVGLYGIWKFYEQTRDARSKQIMLDWFRDRLAAGPPTKNINTVAPFLTLAYLHEETPNPAWVPYLDEWAEWLMNGLPRTEENGFQHIVFNSVNEQQMWDDTLMMSVLPLASCQGDRATSRKRGGNSCCTSSTWSIARAACGSTAGRLPAATISRTRCGRAAIAG